MSVTSHMKACLLYTSNFNKGIFVDGSEMKVTNTPFSYGVACYPEKHEEAPNMAVSILEIDFSKQCATS